MKKMVCMLMTLLMLLTSVGACAQETVENGNETVQETADEAVIAEETEQEEKEWRNILFLGGDSRSTDGYRLTDSIIIVSVNREECLIKMTSVMRDTWVDYPEHNISNKLNAANVYGGPELTMETINRYFGTDIEDYVMVNMYDLAKIIDMAGGIYLWVNESERQQINAGAAEYVRIFGSYPGSKSLSQSGYVHLNGLLAMSHTRNRTTDNDYGRVMRQQEVLLALAKKLQDKDVNELMEMAGSIMERVETNLDNEEIKELVITALAMDVEDVEQFRIPADNTYKSGMMEGTWKIVPDFETNGQLLHDFIYGVENEPSEDSEKTVE